MNFKPVTTGFACVAAISIARKSIKLDFPAHPFTPYSLLITYYLLLLTSYFLLLTSYFLLFTSYS